MIFARYKGSEGNFTQGKVYLGRPEMNGGTVVGFGFVEVEDDHGGMVRVKPDDGQFEYIEDIYAVISEPLPGSGVGRGSVVVVTGATDDRKHLQVDGVGLRAGSDLIILDRTNVFPGLFLMDLRSGRWSKVRIVDECLWVVMDKDSESRPLTDFRFAVAEGDILIEPIVVCISADGCPDLTTGRLYVLRGVGGDGLVLVEDDEGKEAPFLASRFKPIF